ncbi:hypothetical protein [Mucilaginibacter pedocola]|nr:hypothetical protein [Mucilaginibacter pedocola]
MTKVQLENLREGLYNSYRDAHYKAGNIFIRQYQSHREVVKIDAATGHTEIIKTIR